MRGHERPQATMLTLVNPEKRVPSNHPIRRIQPLAEAASNSGERCDNAASASCFIRRSGCSAGIQSSGRTSAIVTRPRASPRIPCLLQHATTHFDELMGLNSGIYQRSARQLRDMKIAPDVKRTLPQMIRKYAMFYGLALVRDHDKAGMRQG
jgi:hypothetical protein